MVGRGEKSIFMVPAQALSGRCPAGMAYYPKEARLRGEPLGTCLEGKREKAFIPWQVRVLRWTDE